MPDLPSVFVLFIFPSTLPVEDYIQSMPDLAIITGYVNDVLSFYKEEITGDTTKDSPEIGVSVLLLEVRGASIAELWNEKL
ncbi:hypothetical protein K503DRAFT_773896 [Rhizopogon vinicolor AM-OR11-026]|uniref:Terpenoid synthase n=1 Tax=Rhizopogon vinicolor AM-OR11-026 TaxID=1314800 RepID=A0A1B7MR25_9AGAM|nr:hypothetical protein K503DRAFT_773896 [Rhizopogon vinicolor AM-OR11-026]